MYGYPSYRPSPSRGSSHYSYSYAPHPSYSYASRSSYDYRRDSSCSGCSNGSESEGDQGYYSGNKRDFSDGYGSSRYASSSARRDRDRGYGGMRDSGRTPRGSRNPYGGEHRSSAAAPDRERTSSRTAYTVEDPDGNIIDSSHGDDEGASRTSRGSRNPYGDDGASRTSRSSRNPYAGGTRSSARAPDRERPSTRTSARTPYTVEDPDGNIIDAVSGDESASNANTTTSAGYSARNSGYGSSRRRPDVSDYEDTLPRQRTSSRRDYNDYEDTPPRRSSSRRDEDTPPRQRGPAVYTAYSDTRGNIYYVPEGTPVYSTTTTEAYPSSRGYTPRRPRPASEAYARPRADSSRYSYAGDGGYTASGRYRDSGYSSRRR